MTTGVIATPLCTLFALKECDRGEGFFTHGAVAV